MKPNNVLTLYTQNIRMKSLRILAMSACNLAILICALRQFLEPIFLNRLRHWSLANFLRSTRNGLGESNS